ncbi:DUF58 domain-containing protein [Deinococcus ruber]|uniref:DUF58 domain-containing protein n=1 Tax=Deinococcus ruber TaxID=1848197 RepID=A0A918F666_9DEIO|nr:DUF58 domain-containing protein [Deinococcus ruber]GGR12355.1 hypothetical protein GCM10008957_26540 [Deinococcus ruber]
MTALPLTLLYAALLVLLLWGVWRLWQKPPHTELRRELAGQGFEQTSLPLTLHLKLHARLPTRIVIEDPAPRAVVPETQFTVGGLIWGERRVTHVTSLQLNQRGVYRWEGASLRWADPFGLFWHQQPLVCATELEVYPGTHLLTLPHLLRPLLSEGELSRTLGLDDPISLRGARPYLPGDPPGRVHWRLSARHLSENADAGGGGGGNLMVRELERTASSSLHIHLDTAGSEVYLESAVRLAASLVQEALELRLPVALSDGRGSTPSGQTPEHLRRVLRRLAEATVEPAERIPAVRPGSNLIVLTQRAGGALLHSALLARAQAARVVIVALPEGFYLEPGELPRRQWAGLPEAVRELERQAGVLAGAGVAVLVLRGNMSVLRLGRQET